MAVQRFDISFHQPGRTGNMEWNKADPFKQVEDRLWLPAQEMSIEIFLVLVTRDMTQIGQVDRLDMDDRVKVGVRRA